MGVGLVLGGGLAGATEFLDDRLHSEKALKDLLPVAVISELPSFTTPEEEKTEQRKLWAIWATAALALLQFWEDWLTVSCGDDLRSKCTKPFTI